MSARNASITRRRGVTGETSRRVLEALREPGGTLLLAEELGLSREVVWGNIKNLHRVGWVLRLSRGVYQISEAGEEALRSRTPSAEHYLTRAARTPPQGDGWTPERLVWLDRHYARLGHHRCAELLGMSASAVHARASSRGLRFGEVPGYILLADLAPALELDYTVLYARARCAGVLTYPGTVKDRQSRRKAMVPESWADQLASERQPPGLDDVALVDLARELSLSRSNAARLAHPCAYLRTPVSGGQARLYVSAADADRLRQQRREHKPPAAPLGRRGVWQAIAAAGPEGMSDRELYGVLKCSRAVVRLHARAMWRDGELERCREGSSRDPFVWRLIEHQGQPWPQQRDLPKGGRPRTTPLPQAAD